MGKTLRRLRLGSRSGKKGLGAGLLALVLSLALGGTAFSEWGLGAVSQDLVQEAMRAHALSCVNEAVGANLAEGSSYVVVERNEAGEPEAVHTDAAALNTLRTQMLTQLEESLNGTVTVEVPIGSLTGIALLNGKGFSVPLTLYVESSADLSFQTEFVSAGINQSCHRVTMTIWTQGISQSKRFQAESETETSTVLAETVLVGDVPDGALYSAIE
ncbi:MAG: sporulation protein YunB [Acutalibacter sp.]